MCHSPSGALRVQAPVRAAWAVADAAKATLSPAAIPPDTTFCVKRFITDLRMKGGSTALLQSVATCCECRSEDRDHWARVTRAETAGRATFGHRMVPALAAGEGSP